MKGGRPLLKYGRKFEGPREFRELPSRMRCDRGPCLVKVGLEVRPKAEKGSGLGAFGSRIEEIRIEEAMLPVARLRPGIREKHEERADRGSRRKHLEKEARLRAEEMKIVQAGAIPLPHGSADPIGIDIDAYAQLPRMGLRVGGEKMSVPTADLEDDPCAGGQSLCQF